MAQAGRKVKHYHADNGRFADNGFIDAVNSKDQKITYFGVGAHHQNGIIENKNKMLTLGAQTLLLHGMRMWPSMIDTMFWPFAMKAVAERHNKMQVNIFGKTPESTLLGIEIEDIPVKSYHTLFCPIYVCTRCLPAKCWWSRAPKVGTQVTYWGLFGAFSLPRRQRGISVESNHRKSKPSIPCGV